jgi:hypothetical protein
MQEATHMAIEVQTGMDRAEMKRLLLKSKQEPVNCAIGIGNDKSVALLMLARNRSSKSLQGDLQKDFPTAFNTRFGTAMVDTDDDPTLVKFVLNKAVTSMARRLVKTLKGIGFRKVQIRLEDGSPVEAAAEEEAAEQTNTDGATTDAPQQDAAALVAALTALVPRIADVADPARKEALSKQAREAQVNIKTGNLTYATAGIESLRRALDAVPAADGADAQPDQSDIPAPPPPPPEAAPMPDATALATALTELVRRIASVADPARKEALAKQAREAQVNIKTGNLTYAAAGIEALRRALETPAAGNAPPSQEISHDDSDPRTIWREAKEALDVNLNALAGKLRAHDNPDMHQIADLGLFSIGRTENVGLNKALIEYTGASAERRGAAAQQLRQAIAAYRAMMSKSRTIELLADTPFGANVPFQATLGGALDRIEHILRERRNPRPASRNEPLEGDIPWARPCCATRASQCTARRGFGWTYLWMPMKRRRRSPGRPPSCRYSA